MDVGYGDTTLRGKECESGSVVVCFEWNGLEF